MCELCSPHLDSWGVFSWVVFGVNILVLCCASKRLVCPALTSLTIAINQTECRTKWDGSINNFLVFVQFMILILGVIVAVEESRHTARLQILPTKVSQVSKKKGKLDNIAVNVAEV